ncbi:MAG TPA: hydratase [Clostridia bacterium]|mgnify:CR=1 FL=1|nr:hydratase [Clostridia bacterium]
MLNILNHGVVYREGRFQTAKETSGFNKTITYDILSHHVNSKIITKSDSLNIKFDAIASHDITYVGIIQTAKSIGIDKFNLPYVLTNCHNSLCAVGGTINEDDHKFGISAAKKYGGIYVPAHVAVIHTYMRECFASPGKMILGSDSHTRYGALGTLAMGEGGPELVKQLIGATYDIKYPSVVAINLKGKLRKGVGPHDVALALVGKVFKEGIVKNKVLEFVGDGIKSLPIEYRIGIDVMTTETACLSSVWETDIAVEKYLIDRGRGDVYRELRVQDGAYYDALIEVDLSKIEPMIALPFHPSNVYKLSELINSPYEILKKCEDEGRELLKNPNFTLTHIINEKNQIVVDQAIIAGCAGGTYDNIFEAANILNSKTIGVDLSMSVYCGSQPIYADLMKKGALSKLVNAGAIIKTSFCGPCFGAGDVPSNNGFSIRHTTRNFENREGAKPNEGQSASVALMDARSIAATAANKGVLTTALMYDYSNDIPEFDYDKTIYDLRVYNGYGKANPGVELQYGPNIKDWPQIPKLSNALIMRLDAVIEDSVTTTDELIPSGETSSYRSNPLRLAQYALSRKDPKYVERTKETILQSESIKEDVKKKLNINIDSDTIVGSAIYACKPGDGSAREQAASSQRVLGGSANIAREYATKRYRSNLINWGMLPLLSTKPVGFFKVGDIIVIPDTNTAIDTEKTSAWIIREDKVQQIEFELGPLTKDEKSILKAGCLMNFQRDSIRK